MKCHISVTITVSTEYKLVKLSQQVVDKQFKHSTVHFIQTYMHLEEMDSE